MPYQREIKTSPGRATSGRPYKSKDQAGMGTKGELQYTQKMTKVLPIFAETKFVQKNHNIFAAMMLAQMGLTSFQDSQLHFIQVDFKALVKDMMDSDIALMKRNEMA